MSKTSARLTFSVICQVLMRRGSDAPGCREAHGLLADEGGRGDSTVLSHGWRLPAGSAAFANSMAASALDYDSIGAAGSFFGSAAVIVVDDRCCMVQLALRAAKFYMHESCGKCTPCREGTARLLAMLDGSVDTQEAGALSEVIQLASLCGLCQAAPLAVLSGLREFPASFR